MIPERVTPHDLEAERAVLGAVLIDSERLHDIAQSIAPGDFFRQAHQTLYGAMRSLNEQRKPIDLVTLRDVLGPKALEDVGGPAYVSGLMDGVPRSVNVAAYCEIVRKAALRRRLRAIAEETIEAAQDTQVDAAEAIDRAERAIFELGEQSIKGDLRTIESAVDRTWPIIEKAVDTGGPVSGVRTGFLDLDDKTQGFHPGNLILLAARPGMGKSALALNIAHNVAQSSDEAVAFFSLEMSEEEITTRLLGACGRVNMHLVMSGQASGEEMQRMGIARGEVAATNLMIDDSSTQTVATIRSKARRIKAKKGLALVVIDYMQLLSSEGRQESRRVEVGAMSRGLKRLAGELGVPVVALSQLTRSSEQRTDARPRISDLRESGDLEQDANLVLLLHRPEEYQPSPDNAGLAELIIGKNRKGPTGTVKLRWAADETRFDNVSYR